MQLGRRIRTLHVLSSLHRRGAETFAVMLTDRLSRAAFSPAICAIRAPGDTVCLKPQRTPVLCPGSPDSVFGYRALVDLITALRTHHPHLVHCHGGEALKYVVAARPFWRAQACVYTKIGSINPWLDAPIKRRFYVWLMEQTDAIIAVGEQVRKEVEEVLRPKRPRLLAIPTGRDVEVFASTTAEDSAKKRRELGLDGSDVCVITVGSASWEKDPALLLRAFAILAPKHPRARLVFVGAGPLLPRLQAQVHTERLENRVTFLGVRDDIPQLLSAADVFALPSMTEGLPGVLIEAGMAGVPAVAFQVGSVEDVLRDGVTGFVVPRTAPEQFAHRLEQLVGDGSLRGRMGQAAVEHCRRNFDIRLSVRRHESLFQELLDQRPMGVA